jgi:hypothetical protein
LCLYGEWPDLCVENRIEIKETHQSPIATGLTQKLSIFYVSLVFAARIGVVGSLYTGVGGGWLSPLNRWR